MPYPHEVPRAKHDFLIVSDDELSPDTANVVFDALEQPIDQTKIQLNAVLYSYPDGPQHPGPLSRGLLVVGLVDTSHPLVQKLVMEQASGVLDWCTLGVKKFSDQLPDRDKKNSMAFAKFLTKLSRQDLVAILGKDKYGRFGIIKPMDDDEKFAANCFVGDIESAKAVFGNSGNGNSSGLPWVDSTSNGDDSVGLWKPPGSEDGGGFGDDNVDNGGGLWQPPGMAGEEENDTFKFNAGSITENDAWHPNADTIIDTTTKSKKRKVDSIDNVDDNGDFHKDVGAATADKFYSGLTRTLDTRSESRLYHMRAFNGWVKASQISELAPQTQQGGRKKKSTHATPLRVLDLACGKGGDLGKWILHPRKMSNYVGVDVARGSLKDAAIRARGLRNKMERCTFTCADLGADVPGRYKSPKHKAMQKLLSWSLLNESPHESGDPVFERVRGGGVDLADRFDVVSIQFAIHYMMSSQKRARRFFRTVSELLDIGGNLIATTIDARIVIEKLMDLGEDLHFDSENEVNEDPKREVVVSVGAGACRIRFQRHIVKKIFQAVAKEKSGQFTEDVFGLEYTFTLVEGSDHAAGVGEAVDLPEWLTPLPVLKALAEEAGLELEYAQNFHEFFETRKDPQDYPAAHLALYNMKVLNRNGSLSKDEWEISRLYCAIKFRKVREAESVLEDDSEVESEDENETGATPTEDSRHAEDDNKKPEAAGKVDQKLFLKAMMTAKMTVGRDQWESLSGDEKKHHIEIEMTKLQS